MSHPLMKFFAYQHLKGPLMLASQKVHDLAVAMDANVPDGPEKDAGMRKLLEAKDCFVRAVIP